jgi:hypothetical protein
VWWERGAKKRNYDGKKKLFIFIAVITARA